MAQAKFIRSLMQPLAIIPRHQNDNQNAHSAGSCIPQDVVVSYWYLYDRLRAAGVQRAVVLTSTHFKLSLRPVLDAGVGNIVAVVTAVCRRVFNLNEIATSLRSSQ